MGIAQDDKCNNLMINLIEEIRLKIQDVATVNYETEEERLEFCNIFLVNAVGNITMQWTNRDFGIVTFYENAIDRVEQISKWFAATLPKLKNDLEKGKLQ